MEAVERGEFQPSKDAAERIALLKIAAINTANKREAGKGIGNANNIRRT